MAYRWSCKRGNPCVDTRECPCCGELGLRSYSPAEELYIAELDARRLSRYVQQYWREQAEEDSDGRAREERGRLSDKAREARRPLPPENLVGALQDTVHEDTGRTRAVHVGTREEPDNGTK